MKVDLNRSYNDFSTFILKPRLLHHAEPFLIDLGKVSAYETPKRHRSRAARSLGSGTLLFQPFSGSVEASVALSPTLTSPFRQFGRREKRTFPPCAEPPDVAQKLRGSAIFAAIVTT
jgi:hypothetical protein